MSFKDELDQVKQTLRESAYLKKDEFRILYDSQMAVLEKNYPGEFSAFWKKKESFPTIDPKTIRYALKSLLK